MKLSSIALMVLVSAGFAAVITDDLQNAYQNLKAAEARKDAAQVKQAALDLWALVRHTTSAPAPDTEAEKEAWVDRVTYAREIEVQIEYSVLVTALQSSPKSMVDLLSTLEQQNP